MERNWRIETRDWIRTLLLTALLSLGLRVAVVEAFVVPTGSMRPTIQEGDRLLGSKFHYWFWEPKRGELVVFRPPPAAQEMTQAEASRYVKRVIATAGDVVEVRDRRVRVNGRLLDEPYLEAPPRYDMPPTRVPEGQLFVLGDNRNDSLDSHVWGFLPQDALIAHVFARYWPPDRIGGL